VRIFGGCSRLRIVSSGNGVSGVQTSVCISRLIVSWLICLFVRYLQALFIRGICVVREK
jgi:hypothetical protein